MDQSGDAVRSRRCGAAVLAQLEARGAWLAVAVVGGILYVDGHVLLVAWVAWHGGVPEFSDLGWI